jgi:hypothetical protein
MTEEIVNKVANSGLLTINLEHIYPVGERVALDIKDTLFMGMVLKEKDFRLWISSYDWQQYQNKNVAVFCSVDAIIPTWAYMLVSSKLTGIAHKVVFGSIDTLETVLWEESIHNLDVNEYAGKKVVIKGCGDLFISPAAYLQLTHKLVPIAQSVMYGEPCSTVPVYKSKISSL